MNRPMKVAIFSPYATVAPHFETELELADRHADAGDRVQYLYCSGQLNNCDFNCQRDETRCHECVGRRKAGIELINPNIQTIELGLGQFAEPPVRTRFDSLDELKGYRIANFDIGYATLSSLVSLVRDPEPDLAHHATTLSRFLKSAYTTYQSTRDYIRAESPDRVYVFNGRFAAMRAVMRACQRENVDCWLHERGCDKDHYELFKNHLPHDLQAIDQVIRRYWQEADPATRDDVGASWYTDRVDRVERNWTSFVKNQRPGLLPAEWDARRKNIAVFNSSDDEFVAIGDHWKNKLYPTQLDAIQRLATDLHRRAPDVQLYLRVHPNLSKVDNQRKSDLLSLKLPNLKIIPPDAEIDTYQLVRQSDTVVSFGSSVGIEAVYWGVPSVLLGPSLYQDLGGPFRPDSHSSAVQLLCQNLVAGTKTGALMYGYWLQSRGTRFRYYHANDLFSGTYRGEQIYQRPEKPVLSLRAKIGREAGRILRQMTGNSS